MSFQKAGLEAYEAAREIAGAAIREQVGLPILPEFYDFRHELSKLEPIYEHMLGEPGLLGRRSQQPEIVFVPHNTPENGWDRIMQGLASKHGESTGGFDAVYRERESVPAQRRWESAVINGTSRPSGSPLGVRDFVKEPGRMDSGLLPSLDAYLALQTKLIAQNRDPVDLDRPPVWTKLSDTGKSDRSVQRALGSVLNIEKVHLRGSWDTGLRISENVNPDWDNGMVVSHDFSYDAPRVIVTAGKIGLGRLLDLGEGKLRPTVLASQVK